MQTPDYIMTVYHDDENGGENNNPNLKFVKVASWKACLRVKVSQICSLHPTIHNSANL